jgi:hypothetical protein
MRLDRRVAILAIVVLGAPVFASPRGAKAEGQPLPGTVGIDGSERRWLSGYLEADGWLASLEGSLQTPSGGRMGTTSPGRPKLEEIGLDGLEVLGFFDAGFTVIEKHELRVHFDFIDIDGTDTLPSQLVSQGQVFPAGSPVDASLRLHFVRVGYRGHWLPTWKGWHLSPEIGMALLPFRYELRSPAATGTVDRSYTEAYPYYGILLGRTIWGPVDFELELLGAGGLNDVSYIDSDARLLWNLYERGQMNWALVLGLRGTWFQRGDGQRPVQNDPSVRVGSFSTSPWAGFHFGLRLGF